MAWRVAVALLLAMGAARAQDAWPARPIQIVNPASAGSTSDTLLRALAPGLQARLGQPVAVVNREGASGALGTAQVARAAADGTTLLFTAAYALSVLPVTRPDAGYRLESFTPICMTFVNTMVVAVLPDSPYRSLAALVASARARPGQVVFGHQGVASIPHLSMVELIQAAGVEMQDVPYRGDPAVILDLIGGRLEAAALVLGSLRGQNLRPLAVFAPERHYLAPEVPTVREQGFDVAPASFGGLLAPAGLPPRIRDTLAEACAGAAAEPGYEEATRRGFQPRDYHAGPAEFAARLAQDAADKARVLRGVRLER